MDYDYYGISEEIRNELLTNRGSFIRDYWRDGRHFSKHSSKDRGTPSRIVDVNIYENILQTFYRDGSHYEHQGVFNGYRQNDFITMHLESQFILKIDFKNCYRNITFKHFSSIITRHKERLSPPLPMDLVEKIYFPHGYLQAGLSASNIMCDLVLKYNFDKKINAVIHRDGKVVANYSRYYDDMHISSDDIYLLKDIYRSIKQTATETSLPLNYKKSRLRKMSGVKILGSRVSGGAIRIPRTEKNNLRAAMHELAHTSCETDEYEHRLRSVIYRLSRICKSESEPNEKYVNDFQYYKDELKAITEVQA